MTNAIIAVPLPQPKIWKEKLELERLHKIKIWNSGVCQMVPCGFVAKEAKNWREGSL